LGGLEEGVAQPAVARVAVLGLVPGEVHGEARDVDGGPKDLEVVTAHKSLDEPARGREDEVGVGDGQRGDVEIADPEGEVPLEALLLQDLIHAPAASARGAQEDVAQLDVGLEVELLDLGQGGVVAPRDDDELVVPELAAHQGLARVRDAHDDGHVKVAAFEGAGDLGLVEGAALEGDAWSVFGEAG
jgi:hypothetical protein